MTGTPLTAAFALLSGFTGVGVAWIFIATVANYLNGESGRRTSVIVGGSGDAFVARSVPILIVGGIIGVVAGLFARWVSARRKSRAQPCASPDACSADASQTPVS